MYDYIVKDSSIWHDVDHVSLLNRKDATIKVGIVKAQVASSDINHLTYIVEVMDQGRTIEVPCSVMTRLSGPYNFEEYNYRPYATNVHYSPLIPGTPETKGGDLVIISYLGGHGVKGVILGAIGHPSRKSELPVADKSNYIFRFNGLEQKIEDSGAFTVTFNAKAVNDLALGIPGNPILPPLHNKTIAGTAMKFEAEGSWEVGDNALPFGQLVRVDKTLGTINITSGDVKIVLDKKTGAMTVGNVSTKFESKKSFDILASDFSVTAPKSVKIKSAKVAIGFGPIELLDTIIKLVDKIGTVVVTSPVGPCSPLMASTQWLEVIKLKVALNSIKGSL